jgi:ParB/RepB/Spo0J family partition protein
LIEEIPLEKVFDNPFNSRLVYAEEETSNLALSFEKNGQLSPIKVRKRDGRFELIFGHRRVQAARRLGWHLIRAEIVEVNDEAMATLSLVENIHRKNLSDFELAQSIARLAKEFGWGYEEISDAIGWSKSHVCNFVRMSEMFESSEIDTPLLNDLLRISEHHARLLLRISDKQERKDALRFTVREKLSVRDLERIFFKLRGLWASPDDRVTQPLFSFSRNASSREEDIIDIQRILQAEFDSPRRGSYESFLEAHALGQGFSMYSSTGPLEKLFIESEAVEWEKNWFHKASNELRCSKLENFRVQFVSNVAIVTLFAQADYQTNQERVRGTVIMVKHGSKWRILHEHWSEIASKKAIRLTA